MQMTLRYTYKENNEKSTTSKSSTVWREVSAARRFLPDPLSSNLKLSPVRATVYWF